MHRNSVVFVGVVGLLVGGCDTITGLIGGDDGSAAHTAAEASLKSGDLPAAADGWESAQMEHPENVDVASGAAFSLLLKGDPGAADQALAAVEPTAGDRLPEVKMRRALVALEAGDLDAVGEHGRASGLPAGKLLAAEVALADGESDDAIALFREVKSAGGSLGRLAGDYLERLDDEDMMATGLAEAEALWALGERKVGVETAEALVQGLPEDREEKGELVLLWAGRAVSVGAWETAQGLIDPLTFPPDGQKWRMDAIQAMVYCVQGELDACKAEFDKLDRTGPATGVADARATAAYLIAEDHPDAATDLVGSVKSNAAARALLATGDAGMAQQASPGGVLDKYLASGG